MANTSALKGLLTGCLLLAASPAWAAPTVAQMLTFKPKFDDVHISTPAADEHAACEVKLVTGTRQGASGWLLLDSKKLPVRRFFDSNGDKKIDMWSYFKDGKEVYREVDSNFNERPDQYRWLNTAGMKWGVSTGEDGKIDSWQMIAAEEIGHEVFAALASNDYARLQALFISETDMRALKLPAAEAQRLVALQKGASAKFQATRAKLPHLDGKAVLRQVESATPHCVPADSIGAEHDLIRYPSRTVLFETADKKHDWIQTGEMIKVGMTWRLADAPSPAEDQGMKDVPNQNNPALQKTIDMLAELDRNPPPPLMQPKKDKAVQDYNVRRAALIQQMLEHVKADERENWIKQVLESLSSAYQAGHEDSLKQLASMHQQLAKNMPGSSLAGYAAYRELWATYAPKITGEGVVPASVAKVQVEYLEKLAKFATAYPKAEDTPDALVQLANDAEYSGRDEEAKRWYQQVYENFPEHPLASRAKGSHTRLSLIGQPLALVGPQLGSNAPFDINNLKGKVVVVYYWSSTVSVCERDFVTLKRLHTTHAKDLEVVCINLDEQAAVATQHVQKYQAPGIHLFQATKEGSGLNSPLATFYGINGLPHLFLVGRDGRVINRTLQVGDLENELKKAL